MMWTTQRERSNRCSRRLWGWLPALVMVFATVLPVRAAMPAAPVAQGQPVQRIRFATGATGATVDGYVANGQAARYVLYALANQTMTVQAAYESAPVIATIFDRSGAVLGTASGRRRWSGVLPRSGDYYITVSTPYDATTYFSMRVEVVSQAPAPTPEPGPERIRFASGASSASVTGSLASGATKQYVLRALRGQVMSIQSWIGGGPYRFTVQGSNGVHLGSANGGETWTGTLPATQDYLIMLQSPAGAPPASYSLLVAVVYASPTPTPTPAPPLHEIRFPRGATSTTVWGYVDAGWPGRYFLRARRGQVMSVQLSTEHGYAARVSVVTEDGVFLGAAGQGESWSGVLPITGDYYLTVEAPAAGTGDSYSLWVGIR
ncbi:MAG TPA: hypothetical protein VNK95_25495 [Caldilineaceae bacterium]|nr:hypothetical protein [Caldilineaceae bacterium]